MRPFFLAALALFFPRPSRIDPAALGLLHPCWLLGRREVAVDKHAVAQHLSDVENFWLLLVVLDHVVDAVVHHGLTERAANRNGRGAGGDSLFGAVDVNALTDGLFHPHARATSTTAEAGVLVAWHLHQVGAGGTDQLTRSLKDLVVATQEAGVVVGDLAAPAWRQPAGGGWHEPACSAAGCGARPRTGRQAPGTHCRRC